ncbi:YidH family protein [Pseudomonas sp.]|jgi:putative membrane protein|uniref:YidH family protein n=1 Tax=Pseudomonas sp. TaxID=306 RepID=UPI002EDB4D1D
MNSPEPGNLPPPASAPATPPERDRLSASLLGGGCEPDPRFTLANERTFLAWIRTALAFLAGGIAVEAFTNEVFSPGLRRGVALSLLVLALLVSASACTRWLKVERAMRQRKPLPLPVLVPILSMGGALVAAGLIVFLIAGAS